MFINITNSATSNNKGSSGGLVNYLEKENRNIENQHPEYWFNDKSQRIAAYEVRRSIDHNIAKLGKSDAKFFLVNISPSQKELKYLLSEFGELGVKQQMKIFAEKVMDGYAKNFKREHINDAKDLLWFGKVEYHRYYSHKDIEVKNGSRKRGEVKDGEQMHIQIIVSRKDLTNKIKLSPMNISRGKNIEHSEKIGQFNRMAFKQCGENLFDELFGFDRQLTETLAFANIHKNGSIAQKEQIGILSLVELHTNKTSPVIIDLAKQISTNSFNTPGEMLQNAGKTFSGFIELLMEPNYQSDLSSNSIGKEKKRKLKKLKQQDRGRGI